MLRTSLIQAIKPNLRISTRTITTSAIKMGEGDTGAPRSGGSTQGDAFTKREQANEDYHIRQREIEKLQQLKEKIAGHQRHLAELDKNV
ncbi:MAG: hypothetical protein Q9217_000037 [Psora testacea]